MSNNLPAATPDARADIRADVPPNDPLDRPAPVPQRPISVAFLPLGLVVFITLAFVMAAWTFLSAAV